MVVKTKKRQGWKELNKDGERYRIGKEAMTGYEGH